MSAEHIEQEPHSCLLVGAASYRKCGVAPSFVTDQSGEGKRKVSFQAEEAECPSSLRGFPCIKSMGESRAQYE
jgi:hypothetical protein